MSFALTSCFENFSNSEIIIKNQETKKPNWGLKVLEKNSLIQKGQNYITLVKSVYDGDTFTDKNNFRFRLFGIDTPEIKLKHSKKSIDSWNMKFYAQRAKKALENRILNYWIKVEIADQDKYKRIVAIIRDVNGKIINLDLVAEGFAISRYAQSENPNAKYFYPNYKKLILQLKKAQLSAQQNHLNIWKVDINRIYNLGFGRQIIP